MAQREQIEVRRQAIVEYINQNGKMNLHELADILNTSEITIRRDLNYLEKANLLIRTHGGAVKQDKPTASVWQVSSIESRLNKNAQLKTRIALHVAGMIQNNTSLILDGGSTVQILAGMLKEKENLLVVTNSSDIASIMLESQTSQVVMLGGELQRCTNTVSGADTEEYLSKYFVDVCVVSMSAADPNVGCYAALPNEASLKRKMMEHAQYRILMLDSTKFNRKAFCLAFPFDYVDIVVTDDQIDPVQLHLLKKNGIKVQIV